MVLLLNFIDRSAFDVWCYLYHSESSRLPAVRIIIIYNCIIVKVVCHSAEHNWGEGALVVFEIPPIFI